MSVLTVHVQYTAQLRAALGVDRETLPLLADQATLGALVEAIHQRHGNPAVGLLPEPNAGASGLGALLVAVNDEQIVPKPDAPLADGDRVAFLAPISGGDNANDIRDHEGRAIRGGPPR